MIFERLEFIDDPQPRAAALNMAIDEALLEAIGEWPILRVYRWARPAVSFGCFGDFAGVRRAFPTREWVRRWTGGGVVEHGADVTYSVVVPRPLALAMSRPAESYRLVHEAIRGVLDRAEMAAADEPKVSPACFENPVRHDLLRDGRKLAGAAQRRTRQGLLHQGSIQAAVDAGSLAAAMAPAIGRRLLSPAELVRAQALVATRYGTVPWLEGEA